MTELNVSFLTNIISTSSLVSTNSFTSAANSQFPIINFNQIVSIWFNLSKSWIYIILYLYIAILFAAQPPPRQLEGLKYLTRPGIPSQHAAWSSELLAMSIFSCSAFPLFPCKTDPNKKVSIQVDYLTGRVSNQQGMAAHGILLWHFDQQAAQVWSNGHVIGTSGRPGMHCSGRRPRARSRIWRALNAWRLDSARPRDLQKPQLEAFRSSNRPFRLIKSYSIIEMLIMILLWLIQELFNNYSKFDSPMEMNLSPTLGAVEPMASKGHWAQGSAGGRRCSFGSFGPWRSSCRSKSDRNRPSHLDTSCFHRTSTSLSKIHEVSASESAMFGSKSCFFCLGWECAGSKDWIFLCGMGTVELCVRVCICVCVSWSVYCPAIVTYHQR